jgi:ElaB/YqjD/DUF883 family membrane-anchored ribosome-binding protein
MYQHVKQLMYTVQVGDFDDDLALQGGNIDLVVGKIQQRTGDSRESIKEYLNSLTSSGASALSQAAESAGQYARQAGTQIRDRYHEVSEPLGEGYEQVERVVRDRPTQSVAAALGIGLVVGVMVGMALKSR